MNTEEGEKWQEINHIQNNFERVDTVNMLNLIEKRGWSAATMTVDQRILILKEMGKWEDL